jgi:undecaprenyl-diphosphatase
MITFIHAIIFGIIEGITEFLPISSTGHLILTAHLLGLTETEFLKSFQIIIQLGAILAVVVLYWRSFFDLEIIKRLVVGFIPTGIIGLLLYKVAKQYLLGNESVVLWALAIGGLLLLILEFFERRKIPTRDEPVSSISYAQAFLVGIFQAIAIIPGVSRSAATISGGLLLRIPRKTIIEFSFLLAVPTMLAATALDIFKSAGSFSFSGVALLVVGFLVSFFVAVAAIKWLLQYLKTHTFVAFGFYRIALAVVFLLLVIR